ncbi:MAG: PilZ domain-containing protein [Sphingomicrobium sp.]
MKLDGKLEGRECVERPARITVCYDALVRLDWGTVEAQILDVSGRGFRLRCRKELEPGTEVTLEVPKLAPVRAIIRWTSGKDAGGVFAEPVAL